MRLSKPGIALSIIGVAAFGGFFVLQYFDSHKMPELESAKSAPAIPAAVAVPATQANGEIASNQVPPGVTIPPMPPDVEKLNAMQKEIATLSGEEIEKEVITLKARLNQNDTLNLMKQQKLVGEEKEEAKKMLIRMALLNVEKAKRGPRAEKLHDVAEKNPAANNTQDADEHEHVE